MTVHEYILIIMATYWTHVFLAVFIVLQTNVWVKNGYAGLNEKLEHHEVDVMIAHILSEGCFLALFLFCMLEPWLVMRFAYQYSTETKIIFGATFMGSVGYAILGQRIKDTIKLNFHGKKTKTTEVTETSQDT